MARLTILVRVVILKVAFRKPQTGGGSSGPYSGQDTTNRWPKRKLYGQDSENTISKALYVSREYRISPAQGINSKGTEQRAEQAAPGEPTHPRAVSDRELSIKKQPTGPHPGRPDDVLLEQLPLSKLELCCLRRGCRKSCGADHDLSNDPGGRGACVAATCGCWKDASGWFDFILV